MSIQISLKLSDKMFETAKDYADNMGYDTLQDFIRETMRKKLFEEVSGMMTYKASEESLAKNWMDPKEDKAWEHLQKET